MKKIKILQATIGNGKDGVTKYICQNYIFIDKNKFDFDFITYDEELDFRTDFEKMGANFYKKPSTFNVIKYIRFMKNIQKKNQYDIIHFNLSYANPIPILIAKFIGIKRIIIHAHSTQVDEKNIVLRIVKNIIHLFGKWILGKLGTDFLSCSELAARWMFPKTIISEKKYMIIYNAIDFKKYIFNDDIRRKKREELNLEEKCFCIGHVGRFNYQKNHLFLIKIFKIINQLNKNTKLLLVGTGSMVDKVKKKVIELGLSDSVIFLGSRNDVNNLYSAMDCLILPSRFEGLGIVLIEAQAAGLYCYVSDVIPKEVEITNLVKFISLNESPLTWANEVNKNKRVLQRNNVINELRNSRYDINNEIKILENIYLDGNRDG